MAAVITIKSEDGLQQYLHNTPLPATIPETFYNFWSWGWQVSPVAAWEVLRLWHDRDLTRSTYTVEELVLAVKGEVSKQLTQAKDATDGSTNPQA
jgi:hypothetical protein